MLKKLLIISSAAFIVACGSNTTQPTTPAETKDSAKAATPAQPMNELADFEFHTLVINIPSPLEILTFLPKSGVPYNKEMLNSVDNQKKYATSTRKGLNYGGYIVDLVYLSTNEQFSEVKNYFKTAHDLAQSLGCAESFDNISGTRLEKNIDQKDTINKVIDQIYTEMDSYLRSNDRLQTATQILVGSWIESQYITVNLIKDTDRNKDNDILFQKVKEQNFTSQKLVELLKEFSKEKDFKATIDGVNELDKMYQELQGNGAMTKEALGKLAAKLTEVRGKMVN
jgi:hypothetical protein